MSRLPIVYLGPSIPRAAAEQLLSADYRPPIRRGDLPARCQGRTVIIIDGEFGQSLSVSPKEILQLLDQGTRVIGAASMGALRAAELYPYGMAGCGWIFEAYKAGLIIGDDEVALSYSPIDASPLTIPLVNVRFWLKQLQAAGRLDSATARRLLRTARQIFYAERTFKRLQQEFEAISGATAIKSLMRTEQDITDIKGADAKLALLRATSAPLIKLRRKEGSINGYQETRVG
ncbi:MAG: TfuA-related McrA-glycine thioamidation protein [Acidobacteria bacterium]|nr:MAG: TfuA-related McrA-glycine thioamidation protein [Acidobacteriota bacterium]